MALKDTTGQGHNDNVLLNYEIHNKRLNISFNIVCKVTSYFKNVLSRVGGKHNNSRWVIPCEIEHISNGRSQLLIVSEKLRQRPPFHL